MLNNHQNINATPQRHVPSKDRILCMIDHSITSYEYAKDHVMRPTRLRLLYSLIKSLGLDNYVTMCTAKPATPNDLLPFHTPEYVWFLMHSAAICNRQEALGSHDKDTTTSAASLTTTTTTTTLSSLPSSVLRPNDQSGSEVGTSNALRFTRQMDECCGAMQLDFNAVVNCSGDCPLFPQLWDFVASYTGASLAAARALRHGVADIAMNWSGGLHHAAPHRASGFCYVNDIVLAIRELLQRFQRVLYIDIDVHHGDGVEHAFWSNPRVFTFSMHQYGRGFFPESGPLSSVGGGAGEGFCLNIPLRARTGDEAYVALFRIGLTSILQAFDPEAIVVQCGADTICGDLIGRLAVTTRGHNQCVEAVLRCGLPTLLLGGGGYHVLHTAKCWATHTSVVCGRQQQLPAHIPRGDVYYKEYRREYRWEKPTVHVNLDVADSPLPLAELKGLFAEVALHLRKQMRSVRCVRGTFPKPLFLVGDTKKDGERRVKRERE